jgi:branched-chain amino acid transport system permease protein
MATAADALRPARQVDLASAVRLGLVAGIASIFVASIGLVQNFQTRLVVGELPLGYVFFFAFPLLFGYLAAKPPPAIEGYAPAVPGPRNLLAGLLTGAGAAAVAASYVTFVGNVNVRHIFLNITPALVDILTFGRGLAAGTLILVGWCLGLGTIGGALHLLPDRLRRLLRTALVWILAFAFLTTLMTTVFRQTGLDAVNTLLYGRTGALSLMGAVIVGVVGVLVHLFVLPRRATLTARLRDDTRPAGGRNLRLLLGALALLALGAMPQILGQYLTSVANLAGIFMLLALGLNIQIGFAGLLNLGHVAFLSVGAYTTGVLTAPGAGPELPILVALPISIVAGAIAGVLVGAPVIRMRGDYLAIVTLGFAEIVRLLAVSNWLQGTLGGAQGITRIPSLDIGVRVLNTPQEFFYAIFGVAVLAIYISYALQNSRMGRAWVAMREDESVAEAMGVNVVAAKIWAFVIGAAIAGLAGTLYASNIHSIFPASFGIEQSILILIIVIVGGMGSVPGVVVASLLLIALPELLREFREYRFLIYGALLIFMMISRPEGLIPSRRRAAELREDERAQDEWLRAATASAGEDGSATATSTAEAAKEEI